MHETGELRSISAETDLPPTEIKRRYLICAVPRSGSSLITDALRRTGLAGYPAEYLHPRNIAAYAERFGKDTALVRFPEYIHFLETHRTTPNGLFGMKVHPEQFVGLNPWFYNTYLRGFGRFIVVTRRNLVAQAISQYRARAAGLWNTEDPDAARAARSMPAQYSRTAIAKELTSFSAQQDRWSELLADREAAVLRITYEDLTEDYTGTMARIVSHLDLPPVSFEPPRLQKLADALSEEWESRFLAEISGRSPATS